MYINVDSTTTERRIFLTVLTNAAAARAFNIRVSQLHEQRAPAGCLQYYEEAAGFVQTFNYEDAAEIVETRQPSYFVSMGDGRNGGTVT